MLSLLPITIKGDLENSCKHTMQLFSALVLSALAYSAKASPQKVTPTIEPTLTIEPTFTTRPTLTIDPTLTFTPVPTPDQCICPGKLLCCATVVDSADPVAQSPLTGLGVHITGTSVDVGINCRPYNPRLVRE